MAHFDVYEYRGRERSVRYIIDIQHPIHASMSTRVVVPLRRLDGKATPISRLNPQIEVNGEKCWAAVQQVANVSTKQLGRKVGSAIQYRDKIVDALDMLVLGI